MSRQGPGKSWLRAVVVGAAAAMLAVAAAAQSGEGRATGRFIVDGKPFTFAYAYAQLESGRDGPEVLWVLLTEKPASPEQLAGRLRDTAASDQLNALAFALDAQNEPSDWRWSHPALSIGCALCSDLRFQVSSRTRDEIGGTVFSAKQQSWQKQTYEFRASFTARIRRPSEPAGATVAQKDAIKKLQRMGLAFRAADFYLSRTEPDAIRLFLDAGLKPDTLAPGATETLLLDVLGSGCSEPRVRAVALMLIAAGANPNYRSPDGNVPLLRVYRCADVADALLKAGANLALPSPIRGETVGQSLMENAITFGPADVVRLLVARGYDVKRDGPRLLEKARDRPEVVQILRAAGAATAAPTTRTPLAAEAATKAAPAAVPKAAPAAGRTARTPEQARQELARRQLTLSEDAFWGRLMDFDPEATLLYLEAGISPSARRGPPQNDTPLLFVTSAGCAAPDARRKAAAAGIALALIGHKADVSAKSENETTALVHAAESCPPEVVRALLKAGASTRAKARGGATAMLLAVLADREDNVRALVDGGYDVKAELPGLLAVATGKPGIEALLKQAAGKPLR
jgi:ankyrin repeat protein